MIFCAIIAIELWWLYKANNEIVFSHKYYMLAYNIFHKMIALVQTHDCR